MRPRADQDGRVEPRPDLRQAVGCKHGIRDETYSAALELVNHQYRHAFAAHWGDGTTSSSDGQRFRAGGRGESTGHVSRSTVASRDGCSIPISPTSTRRSAPAW
ncbi:Tn3 family transposase [Klebsiella pneumoniae]|uniref:Tn3 family transposase n=1 Tax=Klebsiella pneumoniae TaxID=573 RepID=UPI00388DD8F4